MRPLFTIVCLCVGCASTPARPQSQPPRVAPSAEPAPRPDPERAASWVNTAEYVRDSTARWTAATLVDGSARTELPATDVARIAEIVAGCVVSDGWAATSPPWPSAVIEARAEAEVVAVFQLQVRGIRIDSAKPYEPSLASMHSDDGPSVQDCDVDDDDQQFLWAVHQRALGATQSREYEAPQGR